MPFSRLDITFPSQIEVRINGEEVKANYKGLKNKPGSTRPVDITNFIRTSPANHRSNIVITYALTQKASLEDAFLSLCSHVPCAGLTLSAEVQFIRLHGQEILG